MPRKKSIPKEPKYIPNAQAGWHGPASRWLSKQGKFTTKEKAVSENEGIEGGWVKGTYVMQTPVSDIFATWESVVDAGAEANTLIVPMAEGRATGIGNTLAATLRPPLIDKRPASWMDSRMRARMLLGEHYFMTEGDASHVCSVPVELVAGDIDVDGPT